MTTLADLTPEQRVNCVGMWAEATIEWPEEPTYKVLGVIKGFNHGEFDEDDEVRIGGPLILFSEEVPLTHATVRHDLPRAWNPDGTPPKGEWEEGRCYTGGTPTGDYACLIDTQDGTTYTSEETPTGDIRRFVGEWEPTE